MPQTIEAFQFKKGWIRPDWFEAAMRENKAQVTWNEKQKYISIYGEGQMEKAFIDYWICRSEHGKIFVLDDVSFKNYWSGCE